MPTYEVEINGEQYEVEAPDEKALTIAIGQIQGMGSQKPEDSQPASSGGFDGAVRTVARGALGIGSYLDELDAATNATLAPIFDPLLPDSFEKLPGGTWGERYDQALDIQRRKDREYDEESPWTSAGLKLAGGVGSGGALLKAAPVVGNYVLGNTGASIPGRLAASGLAGGGTGFVQGFGAGEGGAENRLDQGKEEGLWGLGTGVAAMPVAAGLSTGAKKVAQALIGKTNDALSTMGRAGRDYVTRELADPDKMQFYRQSLDELGPDAVLADVSPDWLGVARGAATRPGTRGLIIDPIAERAAGMNARLRGDMDANLGPRVIPSQIEQQIEATLDDVSSYYRPLLRDARSVDTADFAKEIDQALDEIRGPERSALKDFRSWLNKPGKDELTSDPNILLNIRHTLDTVVKDEKNAQVVRQLTIARQGLDGLLADAIPGLKELDAQFAELSRQGKAIGQGRRVLNNEATALRPEELQDILSEGALPQGLQIGASAVPTRIRQSARGEIDRAVGTQANDLTALRKVVRGEGDWNRDKLAMLFGKDGADKALNAIDRERVFEITGNRISHGSDTAMANRFGDFLDDISKSQEIPMDTTVLGGSLRVARSLAKSVLNQNAAANAEQIAEDIGRLSVMKGAERDALVDALTKRGKENVVSQQRKRVIDALVRSAGMSGYQSLPGVRN